MDFDTMNDMLVRYGITDASVRGRVCKVLPFTKIEPAQLEEVLREQGAKAFLDSLFPVGDMGPTLSV